MHDEVRKAKIGKVDQPLIELDAVGKLDDLRARAGPARGRYDVVGVAPLRMHERHHAVAGREVRHGRSARHHRSGHLAARKPRQCRFLEIASLARFGLRVKHPRKRRAYQYVSRPYAGHGQFDDAQIFRRPDFVETDDAHGGR